MNRTELLEALAPVEGLEEIVVPKSGGAVSFRVDSGGLFWSPSGMEGDYKVNRETAVQALRHVPGMSGAAIKEWPTHLLLEPLNWWFQNGEGEVRALINDDGDLVAFTKSAINGVHSPTSMLDAVTEALDERGVKEKDLYYEKVHVGLDHVSFAVITHERNSEVKIGDVVDAGVMIFGSPTGQANIEMSPYIHRLVCANGMISPVEMGRWVHRGGEGGSLYGWTKEMTGQAWDAIDGEMEALEGLTHVEVDGNVHNVLADLFERHHIPAGQREAIIEAAVEEADGTMFGISQAFNRVANDADSVASMRHLMMVTGDISHQTDRCSACLRVMS